MPDETGAWERVESRGKTVYWSLRGHPCGLRLAVSRYSDTTPTMWEWRAYDDSKVDPGRGSLCVYRGMPLGTVGAARAAAVEWANRRAAMP